MNGTEQNTAGSTPAPSGGDSWFDQVKRQAQQPAAGTAPPAGGSWFDQVKQQAPGTSGTTGTTGTTPSVIPAPQGGFYQQISRQGQVQAPATKPAPAGNPLNPFRPDERRAAALRRILDAVDNAPGWTHWIPGMQPGQQAVGGLHELANTVVGLRHPISHEVDPNSFVGVLAGHENANLQQSEGAAQETMGELFSGEELLGMLGKVGKALPMVERLKLTGQLAQVLDKAPLIGKLVKIGIGSAEQAMLAGGQAYVKTGDVGNALTTALQAGALTAGIGTVAGVGGEKAITSAEKAGAARQATEAAETARAEYPAQAEAYKKQVKAIDAAHQQAVQKAAGKAYGETAAASIEPHLRAVEEAAQPRPVTMAQPGGGPGVPAGTIGHPLVNWKTDEVLKQVGDYTGAREQLQNSLNAAADAMEEATGGRYRDLTREISTAQKNVWKSGENPEAVAAYEGKIAEMDDLLSGVHGGNPEFADAVRKGWRQYYVLGDLTKGLDKSINGVPGASAVSQAQRGINGRTLMTQLRNLTIKHTRGPVEAALGGPEHLSTLEEIAQQTSTNAGRQQLNEGIVNVSKYFKAPEKPAYPPEPTVPPEAPAKGETSLGGKGLKLAAPNIAFYGGLHVGGGWASPVGWAAGTLAAGTTAAAIKFVPATARAVQDAMIADPRIAKYMLYAVRNAVKPEVYGPAIAAMIAKDSQQEQQQPEEQAPAQTEPP